MSERNNGGERLAIAERARQASTVLVAAADQLVDDQAAGLPAEWRLPAARWLKHRAGLLEFAAAGLARCSVDYCLDLVVVDGLCAEHAATDAAPDRLAEWGNRL